MRYPAGVLLAAIMPMCVLALGACSSTSRITAPVAPVSVASTGASDTGAVNPADAQLYIVQLRAAPLTTYAGDVPGLAPTNPGVTGARSLDLNSPASRAYIAYLKAQQEKFLAAVDAALGRTLTPTFVYFYAMNGMTVKLTPVEAAQVAKLPNVVSVRKDRARPPMDAAPNNRQP